MAEKRAPKVSVVIPCFNVERYLEEGINSVLAQSGVTFELIAVDDGSTDATPRILEKMLGTRDGHKLVKKANGGVSSARNAGLAVAEGEYVAFFDPDDIVLPGWLEQMVACCEEEKSDFCITSYYEVAEGSRDLSVHEIEFDQPLDGRDIRDKFLPGVLGRSMDDVVRWGQGGDIREGHVESMVWRFLFRKDILDRNHILFDKRVRIAEDELFISEYALYSEKLTVASCPRYVYRRRADSALGKAKVVDLDHLDVAMLARRDLVIRALRTGVVAGRDELERLFLASLILPLPGTFFNCGRVGLGVSQVLRWAKRYSEAREVHSAALSYPCSLNRIPTSAVAMGMRSGFLLPVAAVLYALGRIASILQFLKSELSN